MISAEQRKRVLAVQREVAAVLSEEAVKSAICGIGELGLHLWISSPEEALQWSKEWKITKRKSPEAQWSHEARTTIDGAECFFIFNLGEFDPKAIDPSFGGQ
jgi:hypothetical protein